ncbi:transposase [Emericellopsis cladophorae]|uniref:Transposase n=1 Tax=Emericellopsis cladophorae TaxID=2686198 RepID=A0A9Q0BB65_9HYPO|nr:transposase [Emericellopsis cladophorae]KAI6778341.1 transposase [Emericellopsis cladophorae]
MDETGFRIGIGKDQSIVTKRKRLHLFGMPENRESATAIECISAAGVVIPAFLILSGQVHMDQWYRLSELSPHTKITLSSSGYSNDQIALSWIKHFDEHTAGAATSAYRLLVIDGHGSHHTKEFIGYCAKKRIIPFALPPHLTHLLQPLDVVVFQPLKHYHAKALDVIIRDGVVNVTKLEFLSLIEGVRRQAFTAKTIKSAFKKTGIWPFDPDLVIRAVEEREAALRTPSPQPSLLASSDFETPVTLRQINKVANRIGEALHEIDDDLDNDFSWDIDRFIRGALTTAAELVQVKRDLSRTKKAELMQRQRRAMKNRPLQSGGVLTVAEARDMVVQRDEDALVKAQRLVDAAQKKLRNLYKRNAEGAAKKARKWRMDKVTDTLEVYDENGSVRALDRLLGILPAPRRIDIAALTSTSSHPHSATCEDNEGVSAYAKTIKTIGHPSRLHVPQWHNACPPPPGAPMVPPSTAQSLQLRPRIIRRKYPSLAEQ